MLALPDDKEQMALPLNGKKNRLKKDDFMQFALKLKIENAIAEKIITKQLSCSSAFESLISISFLSKRNERTIC